MKKVLCLTLALIMLVFVSVVSFSAALSPTHFYGDVDDTRGVQITDSTQIQLYLASQVEFDKRSMILADFDGDGDISILDATNIQLHLAKLPSDRRADHYIYSLPTIDGFISSYSDGKMLTGVPVEFKINASIDSGDKLAYPMSYECYVSKEETGPSELMYSGESPVFTYTFDETGLYYIDIVAYSALGDPCYDRVWYEVAKKPETEPFSASICSVKFGYTDGEKRKFAAFAHGGKAPYEYRFVEGNEVIQDYSENSTIVMDAYDYIDNYFDAILTVYVRDADGNVVSDTCVYKLYPNYPA